MKTTLLMALCSVCVLLSGCAAGISRTGYTLREGQKTKDLQRCAIAIRENVLIDTNAVVVLGSIHAYDTGFSTECDEAYILDTFAREACMLNADLINITNEKQPSIWGSTCYRADAQFLRFKDRANAQGLLSDSKYAPELIVDRTAKFSKRNKQVIGGAVVGGLLGGLIVAAVTAPSDPSNTNYTKAFSPKHAMQP